MSEPKSPYTGKTIAQALEAGAQFNGHASGQFLTSYQDVDWIGVGTLGYLQTIYERHKAGESVGLNLDESFQRILLDLHLATITVNGAIVPNAGAIRYFLLGEFKPSQPSGLYDSIQQKALLVRHCGGI